VGDIDSICPLDMLERKSIGVGRNIGRKRFGMGSIGLNVISG
jgi:hypothetical protein